MYIFETPASVVPDGCLTEYLRSGLGGEHRLVDQVKIRNNDGLDLVKMPV